MLTFFFCQDLSCRWFPSKSKMLTFFFCQDASTKSNARIYLTALFAKGQWLDINHKPKMLYRSHQQCWHDWSWSSLSWWWWWWWLTGTFPPWQIPTMVGFCPWWLWWESVSDKIPPLMKMMKNFNFLIIWLSSTGLKFTLLLIGQFESIWEGNMFVQHFWLFELLTNWVSIFHKS